MLTVTDTALRMLLDHFPLAPHGDNATSEALIQIKCDFQHLGHAARELGDALLALSFSRYVEPDTTPIPGAHITVLRDEAKGGAIVRVVQQHEIDLDCDMYRLLVRVA